MAEKMKPKDVSPEIDAAARYLRETKQAGQGHLVPWPDVPWSSKKKWCVLAAGALAAAASARLTQDGGQSDGA